MVCCVICEDLLSRNLKYLCPKLGLFKLLTQSSDNDNGHETTSRQYDSCSIDTMELMDSYEALFIKRDNLDNELVLAIPKNGIIDVDVWDTITLACVDQNLRILNFFELPGNSRIDKLYCGRLWDNTPAFFHYDTDVLADMNRLTRCPASNAITVRKTSTSCAKSKGIRYEIGFRLGWFEFYSLYDVCYRISDQRALYANHKIHGSTLARHQAMYYDDRRPFDTAGDSIDTDIGDFYEKFAQSKNIGSDLIITESRYFARGHLSRFADGIFKSFKTATNYYVNVNPHWQSVNNGNFKAVENRVSALAKRLNRDVHVITGGYGEMNINNTDIKIGKAVAPSWIYKVVMNQLLMEGIALVVWNNPMSPPETNLCKDICPKLSGNSNGWNFPNKYDRESGVVICCSVGDLTRAIGNIYDLEDAERYRILNYNGQQF